eukprot:c271_g1_i1.p1 GENE.c271_g1_i1~~c271_g1_i1.p1  ORF type:complete len:446 (+),score=48.85 c271_g1_i1:60-1397(+)
MTDTSMEDTLSHAGHQHVDEQLAASIQMQRAAAAAAAAAGGHHHSQHQQQNSTAMVSGHAHVAAQQASVHPNLVHSESHSAMHMRSPSTQTRRSWTPEEDKRLLELVNAEGGNCWSQIATHLEGRVGKQCRERWRNHLDPNIRRDSFSPEEDDRILELVQELGTRWSKIAQRLPGRTENAVKNRYHCFLKNKDTSGAKRSREEKNYLMAKHKRVQTDKPYLLSVFSDDLGASKSSPEGNFCCNLLGCGKQYTQLSHLLAHRLTHFTEGRHPSAQPGPITPTPTAMPPEQQRTENGEAVMLVRALDGLVDDLIQRTQPRRLSYAENDDKDHVVKSELKIQDKDHDVSHQLADSMMSHHQSVDHHHSSELAHQQAHHLHQELHHQSALLHHHHLQQNHLHQTSHLHHHLAYGGGMHLDALDHATNAAMQAVAMEVPHTKVEGVMFKP